MEGDSNKNLNTDSKQFALIIAKRIEHIVSDFINPYPPLPVVDYIIKEKINATMISLNAEKAFNSV